jgi:sporulation protein YlmC with PRC-barrel domain
LPDCNPTDHRAGKFSRASTGENAMKKIILAGASLALLAGPAFAQTMSPSPAPANNMAPAASSSTAPSSSTVGSAPADVKFSTVGSGEVFTSKLKGLNVYNAQNENVGEISDVALNANHQVDALILSVGGFLGVANRYVAVDPSSVAVNYDTSNNSWKATMNTTKDQLKNAPEFTYPK